MRTSESISELVRKNVLKEIFVKSMSKKLAELVFESLWIEREEKKNTDEKFFDVVAFLEEEGIIPFSEESNGK